MKYIFKLIYWLLYHKEDQLEQDLESTSQRDYNRYK